MSTSTNYYILCPYTANHIQNPKYVSVLYTYQEWRCVYLYKYFTYFKRGRSVITQSNVVGCVGFRSASPW